MLNRGNINRAKKLAVSGFLLSSLLAPTQGQAGTPTTGKLILEEMPNAEFVAFVAGMVEGMAYARFRKDTLEAGHRVETGMRCIQDWYRNDPGIILKISDAFRHYEEYAPWVVVGVLIKEECGE